MTTFRPAKTQVVLEQTTVGRRFLVRVVGEIDVLTAPELRAAIDDALDAGANELWIDFTPTEFMDSTGLHVLLDAQERLSALNRRLTVICPAGTIVHRLLGAAGADRVLTVHPDVGAAHRAA